jgi:hypothetical protein
MLRMKDQRFWRSHYVVAADPEEIASKILRDIFTSNGSSFDVIYFKNADVARNILISPGSGGHAFVFAELAYRLRQRGFNVFIMPKHGGHTLSELMVRHEDALRHIAKNFEGPIGVYAEGLGGFVAFYLALSHGPFRSAIYQNAPAIVTEARFRDVVVRGKARALVPTVRFLSKLLPQLRIPIATYLDWRSLVDREEPAHAIESRLVTSGYLKDPDFDRWYPLAAVLSLIDTPPPEPLSQLATPTMFFVSARGFGGRGYVQYLKDLYNRLPVCSKEWVEVDGSVYWMLSHPIEAAATISHWFGRTL